MYCARFNQFGNNFKIYIYPLSHSYFSFNCTYPLTLKFMQGLRDDGGLLLEIHVFWYNGCKSMYTICIPYI